VLDIAFHGVGCAVARASASLLTEAVLGRQTAHGRRLLRRFEQFLESREMEGDADLGELSVFAVVRAHPARKPCALLAWEAWQRILEAADAAQPSPDSRASSRSDHHAREVSTP
jgi:nitrogen fixation NifU-like protein